MKTIEKYSLLLVLMVLGVIVSCEKGPNFREFDYAAPIVNDFHPKEGYVGSDITIEGDMFGDAIGAVKVYFGGVLADTIRSVSEKQIVVQAPENGVTGIISVDVFGKQDTTTTHFTYLPSAKLFGISADKAIEGDEVVITGENFGEDISLIQVYIGGQKVDVKSVTPNEIIFVVGDVPSGTVMLVVDGQRLQGSYLMVGIEKLTGRLIGHSGSWNNNPGTTIEAAVDGDLDTFVDAPSGVDGYVGYDLGEGKAAVVRTVRYAPRSTHASRINGGEIRGANDPSLSDYEILYTITETPPANQLTEVTLDSSEKSYRYIYYINPKEKNCNIAEIEFYGNVVEKQSEVGHYSWVFNIDGDNLGWEPQNSAAWSIENSQMKVVYPQATGNKRADLNMNKLPVIISTGTYPIIAMKANITRAARITFDTQMGAVGGGFNKYSDELLDSHNVYYWDLSQLQIGGELHANEVVTFDRTFQFKIADIPQDDPTTSYTVDWIRTFSSKESLEFFLNN